MQVEMDGAGRQALTVVERVIEHIGSRARDGAMLPNSAPRRESLHEWPSPCATSLRRRCVSSTPRIGRIT